MKSFVWTLRGAGLVLLTTVTLTGACDADHILGVSGGGQSGQSGEGQGSPGAGGTSGAGVALAGTSGTVTDPGGTGGMKLLAGPLGPSQSWTGYIENYQFGSRSDALSLTFAADANGIVKGTMVFGMGAPPPPASDPNVGYPPDLFANGGITVGIGAAHTYISEGYPYSFDGGTLDARRLRFTVDLWQLWASWCALETPASDGSGSCVPNWSAMITFDPRCAQTDPTTKELVSVDCGKYVLCSGGVCACTARGCALSSSSTEIVTFDVFVAGDTLTGSVSGEPFLATSNVHFVKD
jgi:hypothetical protein